MDPTDDDHHRYQSSDEEDFQEAIDKAVTLPKPTIQWRAASTPSPKICSTLIVGTAFGGSSLLESVEAKILLGTLDAASVDLKDDKVDKDAALKTGCNIYELEADPTVIFIACNYEIKDQDSLNFAKTIMNSIQASRIIILDTFSPAKYISGSSDIDYNYPWLRLLQTAGSTTVTKIPLLEVPNLVQNLGAALMAYCEVRGLSETYLLLSLQEHVYGQVLTTAATLRGLKEGLASLGCPIVANQVDVSRAAVSIQDKRVGLNRTKDNRMYA
ncbi:Proteasome assembly chaperone 1 [Dissophora ornata]|nr:Proteasome assembly chaperone 1 [Dissophora ornata]